MPQTVGYLALATDAESISVQATLDDKRVREFYAFPITNTEAENKTAITADLLAKGYDV